VLTSTAIYANTPRKCLGQWSNFIAALKVIRIVIEKVSRDAVGCPILPGFSKAFALAIGRWGKIRGRGFRHFVKSHHCWCSDGFQFDLSDLEGPKTEPNQYLIQMKAP
jgi:hypothetical protein